MNTKQAEKLEGEMMTYANCACGMAYSQEEFEKLEYVGKLTGVGDDNLELRNCKCGSTISIPLSANIECPNCDGLGYFWGGDYESSREEKCECEECNGTGLIQRICACCGEPNNEPWTVCSCCQEDFNVDNWGMKLCKN